MPGKLNPTSPDAVARALSAELLYGTWTIFRLAFTFSSSPARCTELPIPEEPYVSLPGFARASAINSLTLRTGTDG